MDASHASHGNLMAFSALATALGGPVHPRTVHREPIEYRLRADGAQSSFSSSFL